MLENFEICQGKIEFWKISGKTDLCEGKIKFPGISIKLLFFPIFLRKFTCYCRKFATPYGGTNLQ